MNRSGGAEKKTAVSILLNWERREAREGESTTSFQKVWQTFVRVCGGGCSLVLEGEGNAAGRGKKGFRLLGKK